MGAIATRTYQAGAGRRRTAHQLGMDDGEVAGLLLEVRTHHVVKCDDAASEVQRQQRDVIQPLRTLGRVDVIQSPKSF